MNFPSKPNFYPNSPFLLLESLKNVNFQYKFHFQPRHLFFTPKSLQDINFPSGPSFDPTAPFGPNIPFSTPNFPKSLILNSNGPSLSNNLTSLFYLKIPCFRRSILPKSPISNPNAFLPKIPSEHQQPDSVPSTGQHFSNEEKKLERTYFKNSYYVKAAKMALNQC